MKNMFNKLEGIHYKFTKGQSNEKTLVFVHGAGCNWKFLTPLIDKFPEYDCYSIDLPGHGQSDDIGCTKIEDYIEAVAKFIQHLNLSDITVIGYSLGGPISLGIASMNLPCVKNVVILSSGAKFDKLDKLFMDKIYKGKVDKLYLLKCCGSYSNPLVYKQLLTLEKNPVVIKDMIIADSADVTDKLSMIEIPTLIITGKDEILTPVEYSEIINKNVKNSELIVVPNARHMLPVVERELVSKYIKDFLK